MTNPQQKATPDQKCYFDHDYPVPLGHGSEVDYVEVASGATVVAPPAPEVRAAIKEGAHWPASGEWDAALSVKPPDPQMAKAAYHPPKVELTPAEKQQVIKDEQEAEERAKKAEQKKKDDDDEDDDDNKKKSKPTQSPFAKNK
jgi:hypothetical protein